MTEENFIPARKQAPRKTLKLTVTVIANLLLMLLIVWQADLATTPHGCTILWGHIALVIAANLIIIGYVYKSKDWNMLWLAAFAFCFLCGIYYLFLR